MSEKLTDKDIRDNLKYLDSKINELKELIDNQIEINESLLQIVELNARDIKTLREIIRKQQEVLDNHTSHIIDVGNRTISQMRMGSGL